MKQLLSFYTSDIHTIYLLSNFPMWATGTKTNVTKVLVLSFRNTSFMDSASSCESKSDWHQQKKKIFSLGILFPNTPSKNLFLVKASFWDEKSPRLCPLQAGIYSKSRWAHMRSPLIPGEQLQCCQHSTCDFTCVWIRKEQQMRRGNHCNKERIQFLVWMHRRCHSAACPLSQHFLILVSNITG